MMFFALLRYRPHSRIIGSSASGVSFAMAKASGYSGKSLAVTRFTRLSVHWADRIVAISVS